jgi:acyl-CoA reductase-like NAD-dependent aldehyde dehydrogenase
MFEGSVQDPQAFIAALREFHEAPADQRGPLANALSELVIRKRVDLAAVRHALLDGGEHELLDALERLIDLIEPYIEEGGVEE